MHSPFKHSTTTSTVLLPFLFITTIFFCFFSLSSSNQYPDSSPENLLTGEKSRLGSTPPSCRNKCNQCHPCMAVQVPTPPSHFRVEQPITSFDPSSPGNNYSNYKPLGWKCRCNNHLYNP
ncbi:Epidermal patterning factor-like protein [Heracleum sosnowskyi]|uniref:Epidermal patterning factor-like protein n=1 Tax=Heracleum sosnowskyi TaxID=360622 RepID=A0AAD8MEX9_9APIA|nr:Epidermal patterning factor-like protein [Heracleum sosnowskyi]